MKSTVVLSRVDHNVCHQLAVKKLADIAALTAQRKALRKTRKAALKLAAVADTILDIELMDAVAEFRASLT